MAFHVAGRKVLSTLRKGITPDVVEAAVVEAAVEATVAEAVVEIPVAETPVIKSGEHSISLDQSIAGIAAKLETGNFDQVLDAIQALEIQGRNRKGTLAAIAARRAQL